MEEERSVHFGVLHEDGTVSDEREIEVADIKRCPHLILLPDHYRADGSCRCDEADAPGMAEAGYRWDGHLWV